MTREERMRLVTHVRISGARNHDREKRVVKKDEPESLVVTLLVDLLPQSPRITRTFLNIRYYETNSDGFRLFIIIISSTTCRSLYRM